MSNSQHHQEGASSNAGAFPRPEPKLLNPHLFAQHDLIPLNFPYARRANKPIGKAPRDNNWRKRDYSNQTAIEWMNAGYNVGVRLRADQLVIDVDPRNFGGADRLAELCAKFEINLNDYPSVLTGGGGRHVYMSKPANLRVCGALDEFPGIEFKTHGRQVVAAGSVHPQTKARYRADDPFGDLRDPRPAPPTLLQALSRAYPARGSASTATISNEQLAVLLATLKATDFQSYDAWFALMAASHQATGGGGAEEFAAWSVLDPAYAGATGEILMKWSTLSADRSDGITARSLYKAVIDAGRSDLVASLNRAVPGEDFSCLPLVVDIPDLAYNRDGRPAVTLANCLRVLRHANLDFAYDELARRPLLRATNLPWDVDIGRELNDETIRVIRHHLIEWAGMEFSKENVVEACLTLARQTPFNPVVDYLSSLQWDGRPRLDTWLVHYLGAADNEYVRAAGRLALIGAVRRARHPGCKFDHVLILEGHQGSGKSSALKLLGGNWHSDAELGRLDSKDAPLVLQGVWLHELGELTAMGRAEVEDLKAFVSRCEDRFRSPFDRMAHSEARRCVFIGTTNAEAYLFDLTGNRRFWPIKTNAIDLAKLGTDRDQLWAEAAAAEAAGDTIELAPHLWRAAADEQASRLAEDPWKDQLTAYLEGHAAGHPVDPGCVSGVVERVHTRDLLTQALSIDAGRQNQHIAKRLREVMRTISNYSYKRGLRIEGKGTAAGYQREDG